jgi:hypothetical protein
MNKQGKTQGAGVLWAIFGVGVLLVIAIFLVVQQTATTSERTEQILTGKVGAPISQFTVEFQGIALASGAQDAEGDLDYDIFEWNDADNAELANTKHYLDCAGVVPATFDGTNTDIDIVDANMCDVNINKFWSSFTAGDSELKVDDVLVLVKADLDDVDGSTTSYQLKTNDVYLVTVTEGADADEDDVIPHAFLITSANTTTLNVEDILDGTVKIRFENKYESDAVAASKTRLSGSCTDDEDNEPQLDSSLNGFVDSSLTTATTITADCVINVEVTEDGYKVALMNELANSNSERAYLQVDPYGENGTAVWSEYGTNGLTGDVGFSITTNSSIVWEGMSVGTAQITSDSTTDAVVLGGEKLYAESYGFFKDITKGSPMVIPVSISEIKVDYDASTAGGNWQIDANSGSSAEAIADFNLVGHEATTDIIGQTLNG